MSLRRSIDRSGIAHANADSATHARHVADRRARRQIEWVAEPVEDSCAEIFRLKSPERLGLSKGRYFLGNDSEVSGVIFEHNCNEINRLRSWYRGTMKRGESRRPVRRKRRSPACQEIVVNLHPAQMFFVQKLLKGWEENGVAAEQRRELFEALIDDLRAGVIAEYRAASNWDLVGSYIHYDSNKIHVGLVVTRVDQNNRLSPERSLGTLGAWSVGQNRLRKLGLVDTADRRLDENLSRFSSKFGDRPPLDLRLHDRLDQDFEKIVTDLKSEDIYRQSEKDYIAWKLRARRAAFARSPGALGVAWGVLRCISPLLPPEIQTALRFARTGMKALQVVEAALVSKDGPQNSLSEILQVYDHKQRNPNTPAITR
jgi:hypothetical protein